MMKRIYILPNLVTTGNLFCGFLSIVQAIQGEVLFASWLILLGMVFDFLDGRVARLANATSEFGVQYDSLSDVVTFGVAPAILLYQWALFPYDRLGYLVSFLFLACGAFRLARFNVMANLIPNKYFLGLPIPAAAAFVASFVIFSSQVPWQDYFSVDSNLPNHLVVVVTVFLSVLMVSSLRFPSFKGFNWHSKSSYGLFFLGVGSIIALFINPETNLFLLIFGSVLSGVIWNIMVFFRRRRAFRGVMRKRHEKV